jgi:hypothetical protein
MFLLDTNVLSEMMRDKPSPAVAAWVSGQAIDTLFTASVCQAEVLAGIALMPEGRRQFALETLATEMFREDFDGRVLPFDSDAAVAYAVILAASQRAGRPVATADMMIAAIARSRGANVVTRNVRDFQACGVAIINPWA